MGFTGDLFGGQSGADKQREREARAMQSEQARIARGRERDQKRMLEARKRVLTGVENGGGPILAPLQGGSGRTTNLGGYG